MTPLVPARPLVWRRLRRTRLAVQLALLSAVLTASIVVFTLWGLSSDIESSTGVLVERELARSQRAILEAERRNLEQLVVSASLITRNQSLSYTFGTFRLERNMGLRERLDLALTVRRELAKTRQEVRKDLLVATDDAGRVFAAAADREPPAMGTDLSALGAVRHALDTQAAADTALLSVIRLGDAYYRVGVAPIVFDGYTLGALLLGERIDSAFVQRLRGVFPGHVIVTSGAHTIASSLSPDETARLVPVIGGQAMRTRFANEDYLVAATTLGETQDGSHVQLRLLESTSPTVRQLTSALLMAMTWYGGVGIVLAALGAWLLGQSLLRPLRAFVEFLRASARDSSSAARFAAEHTSPELTALNESFEQLMDALSRERTELEQRTVQLSAANTVLTDEIRERERVERALRESEAQLRQSQKLEAIGTLAGGVAHDFNNLLTVISGFTQLAITRTKKTDPVAEDLKQVVEAADRAANLTTQLLAFSRKSVMQPRVLDLDDVIDGIQPMLRRLAGEHIEIIRERGVSVCRIKADPGQIEQVILNLIVNARDAMPHGGRLTITTANASLAGNGNARTMTTRGAMLRVADTGTGIAPEVRERIFEPFFTTKEPGKGTGLGLSTVYGIVTQSGGTIEVDSIVGRGTTFAIVLPAAVEMPIVLSDDSPDDDEPTGGSETVLVVEDEEAVRVLARRSLEARGYRVLTAASGVEALEIARRGDVNIDVLLSDIVMPQMTGPQLIERFVALHPAPCVIFMSGYADDAILQLEIDPGVAFLRKPFTPVALARIVRQTLDASRRASTLAYTPQ